MYKTIGGVLGLGGAMLMAYFHYFATMTNSLLTLLGVVLFFVGLVILLVSRSKTRTASAGHHTGSSET